MLSANEYRKIDDDKGVDSRCYPLSGHPKKCKYLRVKEVVCVCYHRYHTFCTCGAQYASWFSKNMQRTSTLGLPDNNIQKNISPEYNMTECTKWTNLH